MGDFYSKRSLESLNKEKKTREMELQ